MMTLLAIAAAAVVMVAVGALIAWTMQRRTRLRSQFGPEYDRVVEDHGNRREAERALRDRQSRIQDMDLQPLDPAARDTYRAQWTHVQERFVDTPQDALSGADRLVQRVMTDRGYQTQNYQQRAADLSVGHGGTLQHYRTAHDISARAANNQTSTEELRQAMVHYRALFEDLLGDSTERATNDTEPDPRVPAAPGHTETRQEGRQS